MKSNKHSKSIPANVIEQAKAHIEDAAELLKPYLVALTPTERQEIPKMGPKTLNFVEKAHEYAHDNPNLVPNYLEIGEFDTDFADAHGLWTLYNRTLQLTEGISDTQMTAGSEAFQSALVFYNSAKIASSQGISGAQAVYEELKRRFPGKKRNTEETAQNP